MRSTGALLLQYMCILEDYNWALRRKPFTSGLTSEMSRLATDGDIHTCSTPQSADGVIWTVDLEYAIELLSIEVRSTLFVRTGLDT